MKTRLKHIVRTALPLVFAILCSQNVSRAQGTAFTYQGRLNDGGMPASGSYDFRFKLFRDGAGNNQIGGTVLTNGIAVTNGLFMTTIDFGSGVFNGSNLWLEVSVRTNGAVNYSALTPLQALNPTPYAVFAEGASTILGVVSSNGLSGSYSGQVAFNNAGNSFTGNGGGLTNVNAATLGGLGANAFWKTAGNAGTTPGASFVGTTDNQPLEMKVNGARALRLEPNTNGAPNIIAGAPINSVSNTVVGATIAGGGATNFFGIYSNSVAGNFGTVGGGVDNHANDVEAVIAGGYANLASNPNTSIGGGAFNVASGYGATIAGGERNEAAGQVATVGGGYLNTAPGNYSLIAGGEQNSATKTDATVGGGNNNDANGQAATVGGGFQNTAAGDYSTVCGGYNNMASGFDSIVVGGNADVASGTFSLAAGQSAQALNQGSFVWSDSESGVYSSERNDQFKIRAGGGVILDVSGSSGLNPAALRVNSTSGNGVGIFVSQNSSDATAVLTAAGTGDLVKGFSGSGGGNLVFEVLNDGTVKSKNVVLTSDRNAKENFANISATEILEKVAALPITEWNFKSDAPGEKHIGPMAQDFHASFGLNGRDDKHISTTDEGGVALAAIQGLDEKVESRTQKAEERFQKSEARIEKLEAENAELKLRLKNLERFINSTKENRK